MNQQPWAFDRVAAERDDADLIDRARRDDAARVLVVHRGSAPFAQGGLRLLSVAEVDEGLVSDAASGDSSVVWAFLGTAETGESVLLAAVDSENSPVWSGEWGTVRDGAALSNHDRELLVTGVALAAWLHGSPFCSGCGARMSLQQSGWSRRCPQCDREHFPRTDPAVIVAVQSPDGERLLLGANAAWRGDLYSCFAGFVEAGESLETTIHREIAEEAGVLLSNVRYMASQPWPYPRSLMLGFHATAVDETMARGDGEEIIAVRWLTREEIGSALQGNGPVGLPGPASIARSLIVDWYENR